MAASSAPQPAGFPNPFGNPRLLADPYPLYAALRTSSPVLKVPLPIEGPGVHLLTRHADVEQVLRHPQVSVDRLRADALQQFRDRLPPQLAGPGALLRSMLVLDGADHARVRGLVNKAFTPRRVAGLEARVRRLADDLLDAVAGAREMDLMHDLAEPLPAIVIAELLGVPAEDHRQFKQWASDLVNALGEGGPLQRSPRFDAALEALRDYLSQVIERRRAEPRDDLLSALLAAQAERDALTPQELLSNSLLLLLAGHETTTNLVGNGVVALMRQREQWERLRAEPALLPNAIEELLRFDGPVQATVRVPLADVAVGGGVLPAHALVVCGLAAANRDPAVFPDPDRLDVTRANVRHLAFGFGEHFCLGAGLARLEARVVFATLLERAPGLVLASEEVRYRPNFVLRGPASLPVRF